MSIFRLKKQERAFDESIWELFKHIVTLCPLSMDHIDQVIK